MHPLGHPPTNCLAMGKPLTQWYHLGNGYCSWAPSCTFRSRAIRVAFRSFCYKKKCCNQLKHIRTTQAPTSTIQTEEQPDKNDLEGQGRRLTPTPCVSSWKRNSISKEPSETPRQHKTKGLLARSLHKNFSQDLCKNLSVRTLSMHPPLLLKPCYFYQRIIS